MRIMLYVHQSYHLKYATFSTIRQEVELSATLWMNNFVHQIIFPDVGNMWRHMDPPVNWYTGGRGLPTAECAQITREKHCPSN